MRRSPLLVAAVAAALGCGDQGPELTPASVDVTSPIDTILPVGKSAQLGATARDQAGAAILGVAFSWTSSNPAVVSVSGTGLAAAQAAGSATITAAVAGGVSGSLRLRVVEADLTTVSALAGDAFATALVAALSAGKRPAVQAAWSKCASGAESGNVVAVLQCGTGVHAEAASAGDPTDGALLGVLLLYADEIQRRLGL